jgi:hypothetical protein
MSLTLSAEKYRKQGWIFGKSLLKNIQELKIQELNDFTIKVSVGAIINDILEIKKVLSNIQQIKNFYVQCPYLDYDIQDILMSCLHIKITNFYLLERSKEIYCIDSFLAQFIYNLKSLYCFSYKRSHNIEIFSQLWFVLCAHPNIVDITLHNCTLYEILPLFWDSLQKDNNITKKKWKSISLNDVQFCYHFYSNLILSPLKLYSDYIGSFEYIIERNFSSTQEIKEIHEKVKEPISGFLSIANTAKLCLIKMNCKQSSVPLRYNSHCWLDIIKKHPSVKYKTKDSQFKGDIDEVISKHNKFLFLLSQNQPSSVPFKSFYKHWLYDHHLNKEIFDFI